MIDAKFKVTWHNYYDNCLTLHVGAHIQGRSPTVVIRVFAERKGEEHWQIHSGELLPMTFFGDERAAKRRVLHLALELLNGATDAVSDELGQRL